jgi:hypothetical protein
MRTSNISTYAIHTVLSGVAADSVSETLGNAPQLMLVPQCSFNAGVSLKFAWILTLPSLYSFEICLLSVVKLGTCSFSLETNFSRKISQPSFVAYFSASGYLVAAL